MNNGKGIMLSRLSSRLRAFGLPILCGCWTYSAQALSLQPSLHKNTSAMRAVTTTAFMPSQAEKESVASVSKRQGQEIALNGQKYPVAWIQWQAETLRTGISDTGAMQLLGLELLSTQNSSSQPIQYFSNSPLLLTAQFLSPYRYLDITDVAASAHWQLQTRGKTLEINFPSAQILKVRQGQQDWGQRIVLDLDRPVPWQLSQNQQEGVVTLEGVTLSKLLQHRSFNSTEATGAEGSSPGSPPPDPIALESSEAQVKLRVQLLEGKKLRVFSLADPYRLVVDVRSETLVEREIHWGPGVQWHQQNVLLNTSATASSKRSFPVTWLEVTLSDTTVLHPITSHSQAKGLAPLLTIAQAHQASAAINGGFFNRKNQLPLGAIRRDGRWLSGPILNRGAIAWNNQGAVEIARLQLEEAITTSRGDRLPVPFLNSGYVTAGLARYTKDWGSTYTPLTDGETAIWVEDRRVTQKLKLGVAGSNPVSVPEKGYLLILRANESLNAALPVEIEVNLQSQVLPAELTPYPHIVGAGPLLLQNRQVVLDSASEQFASAFNQQAASRSAIGTTARGTVVIAAVHASPSGKGPTLPELASIMQRLGSVDALNLDGGSSTGLVLGGQLLDRSPSTAARVHNGIGLLIR
ncbi:MAG: phosphodiester glycosidase family protein [Cyanophyceae cyanobacterium]